MEIIDRRVPLSEIGKTVGPSSISRFLENVRRNGVIVPILLREAVSNDGTLTYRIVDGNRRVAAARKAELSDIQARVLLGASADDAAILIFISNNFRSANDVTEYLAIKHLKRSGMNRQRIAEAAGMTLSTLDLRERWSRLDRRIFSGFAEGMIAASVAASIARMAEDDQRHFGELFERQGRVSITEVQQYLRDRNRVPSVRIRSAPEPPALTVNLSPVEQVDPVSTRQRFTMSGELTATAGSAQEAEAASAISQQGRQSTGQDVQTAPEVVGPIPDQFHDEPDTPVTIVTSRHVGFGRPTAAHANSGPATPVLESEVQRSIEHAASLGLRQGYSLTDMTSALAVAYRQISFVETALKDTIRG